ncbi:MAG: right-handed parallel beta-helix repeat-containing protein [Verrucomicrobiales bacterium]
MHHIFNKPGWTLAGIIGLLVVAAAAIFGQGGPLNPPGPPGPTMKTLDQIEPRTPISAIPFTISQPGSYYVTRNLTVSGGGDGITIQSDNVTLDLGGFTLDGAGTGRHGVTNQTNYHGLQVRNGNVQNWTQRGFDLQFSFSIVLERVQARNNAIGIVVSSGLVSQCAAVFNTGTGIVANFSKVSDCVASVNPIGINMQSSTLRGCRVGDSSDSGIIASRSVVEGCEIDQCRWGIVVQGHSHVHHNTVLFSGSDGFRVVGTGGSTISDNNVASSGISVPATGIYVESNTNRIVRNNVTGTNVGNGIGVAGSFNTIDDNSVLQNNGLGISVAGSKNTVVRNSSLGNAPPGGAVTNYSIGGGNNPGPVNAANASTNPWSNTQ